MTDCVAAASVEEHENTVGKDFPMFSRPVLSTEFLQASTEAGGLADSSRGP